MNRTKQLLGVVMLVGTLMFSITHLSAQRSSGRGDTATNSSYIEKHHVSLEKIVPVSASLNQPFSYNYTLTANRDIQDVIVVEELPPGAEYVSSFPEASVEVLDEDIVQVIWEFDAMERNQEIDLELVVNPVEGDFIAGCPTVNAEPYSCVGTRIGSAQLTIVNTVDPDEVVLNSEVPWDVRVTNVGTIAANDVELTNYLPEGISPINGDSTQIISIGSLEPGEYYETTIPSTAPIPGEYLNRAVANASNAGEVEDDAVVTVLNTGLDILKTGPEEGYVGRRLSYTIVARNTGDVDLYNVEVVDQVPATAEIISAPNARISGNTATWQIDLPAGGQESFQVVLKGTEDGNLENIATVSCDEYGLEETAASAVTFLRGYPALLMEVIDSNDPMAVGEETIYYVDILNQGSASDTDVILEVEVSEGLSIVSAKGATEGKIFENNSKLTFESYPELRKKQKIEYRIFVQAIGDIGDRRFKAKVRSNTIPKPVTEEESTQVY